jgi:hypothetical protein
MTTTAVDDTAWVLAELATYRRQRDTARARVRLLLAFAREFQGDEPVTQRALAKAAGLSPEGVRQAYGAPELDRLTRLLGRPPRPADGD